MAALNLNKMIIYIKKQKKTKPLIAREVLIVGL